MADDRFATTGLSGLDDILSGLRLGDNVVWRVDDLADYRDFASAYLRAALDEGRRVAYIRFGSHPALVPADWDVPVYELDAHQGFESFTVQLHRILAAEGAGVYYLFDCLSELLAAWATDAMIANFFRVTCPYLFELDTVAYFGLLRLSHSSATIAQVRETTQVLVDLDRDGADLYVHPIKVSGRSSPTMFLPHRRSGAQFVALTSSADATQLFARLHAEPGPRRESQLDHWDRMFLQATHVAERGESAERAATRDQLCGILLGRDERILALARRFLELPDLLAIAAREIGTGYIGGKAVGMLLARAILRRADPEWQTVLEPHDSWYVGSDLFYSYLVANGMWRLFRQQRTDPDSYYSAGAQLHEQLQRGEFPADIAERFRELLEYIGQYPIIVRSSSLQEDGFGSAFAGKYDSVFLVNQGSPEERLRQFIDAVRQVYASAMSEEALAYRRARHLDRQEEQMALLVQRVSGQFRDREFWPMLAGVAVSYNTYVWDSRLDPGAGMLRLVLGLGTRAVDRVAGDYPRIVSLDLPMLVAEAGDAGRFCQRRVDVLDIDGNAPRTVRADALQEQISAAQWALVAQEDFHARERLAERGATGSRHWILSFAGLLSRTEFPALMRRLLTTLEDAYGYPVDVEFTADITPSGDLRVNVVQCRPLQTRGIQASRVAVPDDVPAARTLLRSRGGFMGGSVVQQVHRVIFIDPQAYAELPRQDKFEVARVVGRLNRLIDGASTGPTALLGPGRWGSADPSLGVPIRFAEVSHVAVLAEIAFASGGLIPELSFGSHFFQDLVETGIFYLALFPDRDGCLFRPELLAEQPNRLADLLPASEELAHVVRVVDFPPPGLLLQADIISQQVLCSRPEP